MKRILPPTLMFICLMAMLALRLLLPGPAFFSPWAALAGIVVLAGGVAVCVLGEQQFHKASTPVSPLETPQTLVTGGLYRYSRNPMYLGFALALAGVWLMLGALWPMAGLLAFLIITDRWYIRDEEEKLQTLFGRAYWDYQGKVRRWL